MKYGDSDRDRYTLKGVLKKKKHIKNGIGQRR